MKYKDAFYSGVGILALSFILYTLSAPWFGTYIILGLFGIAGLSLMDLGIRGVSFLGELDGVAGYKTFLQYYLVKR